MQQYLSIKTQLGILHGRDCIFLDQISFENGTNILILVGEVNGALCNPKLYKDIPYKLRFTGILALKMIELDSWDFVCESSFDEVINSEWIHTLQGKVTTTHRHFLIQTYDEVFEVVCENYELAVSL